MKQLFISLSVAAIVLTGCTATKSASGDIGTKEVLPAGADGSSPEKAIVIQEKTEGAGVDAEYAWLKKYYPGYTFIGQTLDFSKDGRPYDVMHIKTAEGKKKDVYFDISNYYGKW